MQKGQDFYRLPVNDRLLYMAGVPLSYIKRSVDIKKMNFSQTSYKTSAGVNVIDVLTQQAFLKQVIDSIDSLGAPATFAIGSHPTEQPGYELATLICRTYLEKTLSASFIPHVRWINVGEPDWNYRSEDCANVTVIHGLSKDSDIRKLEISKDFIRKSSASTIIILATTPNIYEFAIASLGTEVDIVWQLGRTIHRTVI